MDRDTVWEHIHQQRRILAGLLADLDDTSWSTPSLCTGWSVQDVAAHVIASPQVGLASMPGVLARGRFSFNRAMDVETRRRGEQPVVDILAQYAAWDGSRRHPPGTATLDPLVDVLVHTQDIARPLGLTVEAPPEAAAAAADRARFVSPLFGTFGMVRNTRLVATDTDWARGRGEVIEAPMLELLMLVTGRGSAARV
jgi:uncharacterized protein (TIGR03083 family)